jgi:2-dehydro-3-deoxygalactonokinase
MLLAGMIGSNRGWVEAPYVPCPAGADELARALVWIDGRTAIVPGVSYLDGRADVMRGEEVQLIGSVATGEIPPDTLVCHPGTHNKWVRMRGGRIDSFRTVMTGELFSLLKEGSILSDLLAGPAIPGDAFRDGVLRTLASDGVTSALFETRASVLLGRMDRADSASFVSGLLIGEDVRIGIEDRGAVPMVVMGRPELTSLYEAALEIAGVDCEEVDGERAFVAGACEIVERMK